MGHHVGEHFPGAGGHQVLVRLQQGIHAGRIVGQGLKVQRLPGTGKQVVREEVHHHPGIAPRVGPDPRAPFALDAARDEAVGRALRLLHLIAGVSYYKAAVPAESPSGLSAVVCDDQGVSFSLWQAAEGY